MTSSFIICTKDRPLDLQNCVKSIVQQTILPQELIVVDASVINITYENKINCENILKNIIKFIYLTSKPSLTKQRNIGVDNANGDIVFFFDDDVILEQDYHEKILHVYQQKSTERLGGVRGTIGNEYPMGLFKIYLLRLFMLTRLSVNEKSRFLRSGHYVFIPKPKEIIGVECMAGGVCSYYRKIFNEFRSDEKLNGYALKEDMDLSYRVSRKYSLYQTPDAILYHYHSKTSRISIEESSTMRVVNTYYMFKKNMPQTFTNKISFLWSLFGMTIINFTRLITHRDIEHFKGTIKGLIKILTQFFK